MKHLPEFIVLLTLEENYRQELLEINEADIIFRKILHSPYLQDLHDVALMGLENIKAPVDGPIERKPSPVT